MDSTNGTLENLYTLVGRNAVLLALPFGEKRPTNGAWQRTTFERTQEPDYQNDLGEALERQGNIGVLLVGGLATIDIDGDQDAAEFLALNPKLEETLRTRGARGCNLWIRPTGDYPAQIYCLKKIDGTDWGEWRGGGGQTVLGGQHPSGVRYQRLVEKPAIRIAFSEIVWPPNLFLPWVKKERPSTELDKRICVYLATMEGAISGHGGHRQTFKVACCLVNGWGLSAAEAMPYLQAYNQRCNPPWTDKELAHKISDAEKAQHDKPRGYLRTEQNPASKSDYVDWGSSTNSTKLPGGTTQLGYVHPCIYPEDSILSDYMTLAQEQCESADCFIIGTILPVCAAILARRVRFPFGPSAQFSNLFNMITGPPGSRKSSAITLAVNIAKECLPHETFMSKSFSAETLFDEFDIQRGGSPDKLWTVSDAKPVLTDWKKTGYGERVAARMLDLYDCTELTENFRRNATKKSTQTRRHIPQTSTSAVFGATFADASFPGQAVQSGIARRFLFYLAEGMAREIALPPEIDIKPVVRLFTRMRSFNVALKFTKEAKDLWKWFQHKNREQIDSIDPRRESEAHRLNSSPMQTLHVAMIFEACMCAKKDGKAFTEISVHALEVAIKHVDACLDAAVYLDSIANREVVNNDAEILLAKIRKDFSATSKNGTIFLTRSQITATYVRIRLAKDHGRRTLSF